jgi:hypothetical protein
VTGWASAFTCPPAVLTAHALGGPLDDAWSALECAERNLARSRDVLAAIEAVLDDGCSQREVLRRVAARFPRCFTVAQVKHALEVGVRSSRLSVVAGARRAHVYSRPQS